MCSAVNFYIYLFTATEATVTLTVFIVMLPVMHCEMPKVVISRHMIMFGIKETGNCNELPIDY